MAVLIDNYPETNKTNGYIMTSPTHIEEVGQSFTGDGNILNSVKFLMEKWKSPTGTDSVYAKVYAHTGSFGTSSLPTGSALATSNAVLVSSLPAESNSALVTFTFSGINNINLTNGTRYVVTVEYNHGTFNADVNLCAGVAVWFDATGNHAGNMCVYDASAWNVGTVYYDSLFYVYGGSNITSPFPSHFRMTT